MKKAVIVVVAAFLLFWMFTDPRGLADASGSAGGQVVEAGDAFFNAVIDFVGELT